MLSLAKERLLVVRSNTETGETDLQRHDSDLTPDHAFKREREREAFLLQLARSSEEEVVKKTNGLKV